MLSKISEPMLHITPYDNKFLKVIIINALLYMLGFIKECKNGYSTIRRRRTCSVYKYLLSMHESSFDDNEACEFINRNSNCWIFNSLYRW